MNVFIIIPVYNEAKVIYALSKFLTFSNYHLIIVDDASTDKPLFANLPIAFTLLVHSTNLGQGAALQTGMDFALIKKADVIVHFDADGQHNIDDIQKIIAPIINREADMVVGSRFLKNNDSIFKLNIPIKKIVVLQIARYVQLFFTGAMLSDSQNGFRALSFKAASSIKITENKMAHAIEIIQLAIKNKLEIVEIPVVITYTDYSNNKGQKLINGFFIIIRFIQKMFVQKIMLFSVLIFMISLFLKFQHCVGIYDIIESLIFSLIIVGVGFIIRTRRNINIAKTAKIRNAAICNPTYYNAKIN